MGLVVVNETNQEERLFLLRYYTLSDSTRS